MPVTIDSHDFDEMVSARAGDNIIKILAEGDSWFTYPRRFFVFGKDANIVDHLADREELFIYNTSNNGDEAVSMLAGDQKFSLLKKIHHIEFDYLLFSGGGNDLLGKYDFDFLIKQKNDQDSWQNCIHTDRLEIKLDQIKSSFKYLCKLAEEYSKNKNIKVITHTYDYVIPSPVGFRLFDLFPTCPSWIYPYLKQKNISKKKDQTAIMKHILKSFKTCLKETEQECDRLVVVDTQGTVDENDWRNEIHPNSRGFKELANKIYEKMKELNLELSKGIAFKMKG